MKIRDVSWRRYRLPFVAPFRTAHGETTHREGLILRLVDDDGVSGLGEAAPLAEFGGGDIRQSESLLRQLAPEFAGLEVGDVERLITSRLNARPANSAVQFALDSALLDLRARHAGVPLARLLGANPSKTVLVNATVGAASNDRAARASREAVANRLTTVKLKVGLAESIDAEVARVAQVRAAIGPAIALRLDANGGWDVQRAIDTLRALSQFQVELIEQPVAADDLEGLVTVRRSVDLPVAADEALTDLESARRVIAAEAADVLVVKPMACGGVRAARQIIDVASAAGLRVIVTSAIEGGVGVAAALHLASTLPPGSPACGLATADWLADDLIVEPLDVVNGEMRVPAGPGLGVVVDHPRFDVFADDAWRSVREERPILGCG